MANKKISELEQIAALEPYSYFPVAISDQTYKVDFAFFINQFVNKNVYDAQIEQLQQTDAIFQTQLNAFSQLFSSGYLNAYSTTTIASNGLSSGQAMDFGVVNVDTTSGLIFLNPSDSTKIQTDILNTYNIQFSAQFENQNNSDQDINIWFVKNNEKIPNSNTKIEIPKSKGSSNYGQIVAAWNFCVNLEVQPEFVQIYWQCDSTDVYLKSYAETSDIPATPSVLLTVTTLIS